MDQQEIPSCGMEMKYIKMYNGFKEVLINTKDQERLKKFLTQNRITNCDKFIADRILILQRIFIKF